VDYCQTPIFKSHLKNIRASREAKTSLQFQAKRSNMSWVRDEIALLFSQFFNEIVLLRTECLGTHLRDNVREENFKSFFKLTVCHAAERAWFMLHYSHTLPEMLVGLLDDDEGNRRDCFARFCLMASTMLEAETAMQDSTHTERVATGLMIEYGFN